MNISARSLIYKVALSLLMAISTFMLVSPAKADVTINDGAYVSFGRWKHATNALGGHEAAEREIIWLKKGDAAYLSAYLLEARRWHTANAMPAGAWSGSELWAWLNGAFLDSAFNSLEAELLRPAADGDGDSYVTIPNTTLNPAVASASLHGRIRYRANDAQADGSRYWLRKQFQASNTQAWGVGIYGLQGEALLTEANGIAPIISINSEAVELMTGTGGKSDPYILYRSSDAMKPNALSVKDGELTIALGTRIEKLVSLPLPSDFTIKRNGLETTASSVSIGGENSLTLVLTEKPVYGDAYEISYTLPTDSAGILTGGAVKAADARDVMSSFSSLAVRNEATPTVDDIGIQADNLQAIAYRPFAATVEVFDKYGGELTLVDVKSDADWQNMGLTYALDRTANRVTIQGLPTEVGSYDLHLEVRIGETTVSGVKTTVTVSPTGTAPNADSVLITPDKQGSFTVSVERDVFYTITSTIENASIEFLNATPAPGWEASGLAFTPTYRDLTLRVNGTPKAAGQYKLLLDVRIDGTLIRDKEVSLEVVTPPTNPTPADVLVTSDLVGSLMAGKPADFNYTIDSSIKDAEVVLEYAAEGGNWDGSGLILTPDLNARTVNVYGTPTRAGTFEIVMDVRIDGVLLRGITASFTVGTPPTAANLTATPKLPNAKAYRNYDAITVLGSDNGQPLTLNAVSGAPGWDESGLSFTFDSRLNIVRVMGMPTTAGSQSLIIDAAIGGERIADAVITVTVDPGDSSPTPDNITVIQNTTDVLMVGKASDITYTLATGIGDAHIELLGIAAGEGWSSSGLDYVQNADSPAFSVSGTPKLAGRYTLALDIRVDGFRIDGYQATIIVVDDPSSGGNNGGNGNGDGNGNGGDGGNNGGDGNGGDGGNNGGDGNGGDGGNNGGDGNGGDGGNNGGDGNGGDGGNNGGDGETAIMPTGVSLSHGGINLVVGESFALSWTVSPENATDKRVDFSSDNTKSAVVDGNGTVYALAPGKAVITAKTHNGHTAWVSVLIVDRAEVPDIVKSWEITPNRPYYRIADTVTVKVNFARKVENLEIEMTRPDGTTRQIDSTFDDERLTNTSSFTPDVAGNYKSVMTIDDPENGAVYTKRVNLTVYEADSTGTGSLGGDGGGGCNTGVSALLIMLAGMTVVKFKKR